MQANQSWDNLTELDDALWRLVSAKFQVDLTEKMKGSEVDV